LPLRGGRSSRPAAPTPIWNGLAFRDTIRTGTYLDMVANLSVVDPTRVKAAVLTVRGEHDGVATGDDCLAFYR
jgi:hypothetical protein